MLLSVRLSLFPNSQSLVLERMVLLYLTKADLQLGSSKILLPLLHSELFFLQHVKTDIQSPPILCKEERSRIPHHIWHRNVYRRRMQNVVLSRNISLSQILSLHSLVNSLEQAHVCGRAVRTTAVCAPYYLWLSNISWNSPATCNFQLGNRSLVSCLSEN